MAMRDGCPSCDGTAWRVIDTNEATYPEPLVETRRCPTCTHEWTEVLTDGV